MKIEYYSQFGQDKWLIENVFNYKKNGYFIDCGCGHPTIGSNTYAMEKFLGWTGVAIDLQINFQFPIQRSCEIVQSLLSDSPGKLERVVLGGATSGVLNKTSNRHILNNKAKNGTILFPTHTLTEILDAVSAPPQIDLFSLDVEGHEVKVLKGLDCNKYKINTLCIESPYIDTRHNNLEVGGQKKEFEDFLISIGYKKLDSRLASDSIWQRNVRGPALRL
mgnify:CR=1 FL=1